MSVVLRKSSIQSPRDKQVFLSPLDEAYETAAWALASLLDVSCHAEISALKPGQLCSVPYQSGTMMVSRLGFEGHHHKLYVVLRGGPEEQGANADALKELLPSKVSVESKDDMLSLLTLTGAQANAVLEALCPAAQGLKLNHHLDVPLMLGSEPTFFHVSRFSKDQTECVELSVKHADVSSICEALLSHSSVSLA